MGEVVVVDVKPRVLVVAGEWGTDIVPMLERIGFSASGSNSPESALFDFGQHVFDAVVVVLPLPGIGAAGLCHEIRRRGRTPVLLMSAADDVGWLRALDAGADDHLVVPCDERELEARLVALIRRCSGPLSARRIVTVGALTVEVAPDKVTVEPSMSITPIQWTMLHVLAQHPGVVLGKPALVERIRAEHGSTHGVDVDRELRGLCRAIARASGLRGALEEFDGDGWRLVATSR